ncbi:hypothetical protein C0J52_18015 [Blattella germanica]|nr:hypothetical protein C0J52_18015 [Blattella germanica]
MWRVLVTALKEFSLNTSFHALKYIAQDERTWIERIFWICCVTLSWYTSSLLIASSIDSFSNNPISLGVETSYLEWNTNFPSVVVCETSGNERVVDQHFEDLFNAHLNYGIMLWGNCASAKDVFLLQKKAVRILMGYNPKEHCRPLFQELGIHPVASLYIFTNLVYMFSHYDERDWFSGLHTHDMRNNRDLVVPRHRLAKTSNSHIVMSITLFNKLPRDIRDIRNINAFKNKFRRNCTQLFKKCMWFGKEFDCCTYFLELPTEYGTCYAINNLNTNRNLILEYKQHAACCKTRNCCKVYLLSNEMVPTLNIKKEDTVKINVNISAKMHIKVNEIKNGDAVEEVSIDKRQCRFPDENNLKVYPIYSPAGCIVNCRKDLQLKYCNCTSYFMPNVDPSLHCELEGMVCLDEFYNEYAIQKPKWSDKSTGFYCPCEEGCNTESIEQVMSTLETTKEISSISIGGAAGLFVGASLLSFIEFFYFFTVRLFVTMRRLNPTKDTKKKDENKTVEVKPVEKPPETAATSKKTQFPFKPVYEPNVYYTLPPAKPYYKSIHKL